MEKGCLGNAIRNARLKANITQEDLSEKLGISVTHLKHIESEHRLPSVPLLIKIMTVLGMSFDDVVFDAPKNSRLLNNTINLLRQCPDRDLNIINETLHACVNMNKFQIYAGYFFIFLYVPSISVYSPSVYPFCFITILFLYTLTFILALPFFPS